MVRDAPGLYFVGLPFLFSATSGVLPSRGRDAAYIAKHIASHASKGSAAERALA